MRFPKNDLVRAIESDRLLKAEVKEAHKTRFGLISRTDDVGTMVAALAALVIQAMARHLIAGIYDEYFWPILAYLSTALPALAAMAWPGPLDAQRWRWSLPFLVMTVIGIALANSPCR